MKKKAHKIQWQWLIMMGICLVGFVVSLPIGMEGGVGYDLYGLALPNWWMILTILSLGGFFVSAFVFIRELYL
jgi:hypothetical protein